MNPIHVSRQRAPLTCFTLLISAIFSLSIAPLRAQETPSTEEEEPIKLNTFEVKTLLGRYHEDTSSTATKIPMELKEVAGSLQVFNANALMDRNAVTLQDVYTYIIGMNQVQPNS